jgi:hypothetical protein
MAIVYDLSTVRQESQQLEAYEPKKGQLQQAIEERRRQIEQLKVRGQPPDWR